MVLADEGKDPGIPANFPVEHFHGKQFDELMKPCDASDSPVCNAISQEVHSRYAGGLFLLPMTDDSSWWSNSSGERRSAKPTSGGADATPRNAAANRLTQRRNPWHPILCKMGGGTRRSSYFLLQLLREGSELTGRPGGGRPHIDNPGPTTCQSWV